MSKFKISQFGILRASSKNSPKYWKNSKSDFVDPLRHLPTSKKGRIFMHKARYYVKTTEIIFKVAPPTILKE